MPSVMETPDFYLTYNEIEKYFEIHIWHKLKLPTAISTALNIFFQFEINFICLPRQRNCIDRNAIFIVRIVFYLSTTVIMIYYLSHHVPCAIENTVSLCARES